MEQLYHHGIKGQKWGERNGPPYPLNNQPKNFTKTKGTFAESGQNDSKNTQWTTKKKLAVGAAATAAAILAVGGMYVYKKSHIPIHLTDIEIGKIMNLSEIPDREINLKAGQKLQRISSKSVEDYSAQGKRIFVSYLNKDNRLYKEKMPDFIKDWSSTGVIPSNEKTAYAHTLRTKNDIKVPSERTMAEVYMKVTGSDKLDAGRYRMFMEKLGDTDNPTVRSYFQTLQSMGYNAVLDGNDSNWAKSPLILLNPSEDIASSRSHKIGALERFVNVLLM